MQNSTSLLPEGEGRLGANMRLIYLPSFHLQAAFVVGIHSLLYMFVHMSMCVHPRAHVCMCACVRACLLSCVPASGNFNSGIIGADGARFC